MIIICSYWLTREHIADLQPRCVLSLMDPGSQFRLPEVGSVEQHETIWLHDVTSDESACLPPYVVPERVHIERIIDLARTWGDQHPVLIHCMAGVSRSAAAGLIYLATLNPGRERVIAREMRARAPWVHPNALMVRHGDDLLGLEGRLVEACVAMGEPTMKGVMKPLMLRTSF